MRSEFTFVLKLFFFHFALVKVTFYGVDEGYEARCSPKDDGGDRRCRSTCRVFASVAHL
jgi:hypothetical protein